MLLLRERSEREKEKKSRQLFLNSQHLIRPFLAVFSYTPSWINSLTDISTARSLLILSFSLFLFLLIKFIKSPCKVILLLPRAPGSPHRKSRRFSASLSAPALLPKPPKHVPPSPSDFTRKKHHALSSLQPTTYNSHFTLPKEKSKSKINWSLSTSFYGFHIFTHQKETMFATKVLRAAERQPLIKFIGKRTTPSMCPIHSTPALCWTHSSLDLSFYTHSN